MLRLTALFLATFLPSLYVALISFHPGLIPPQLVVSIVAASLLKLRTQKRNNTWSLKLRMPIAS
ncbi:spore germination protein [Paenibacillus ottowii]